MNLNENNYKTYINPKIKLVSEVNFFTNFNLYLRMQKFRMNTVNQFLTFKQMSEDIQTQKFPIQTKIQRKKMRFYRATQQDYFNMNTIMLWGRLS